MTIQKIRLGIIGANSRVGWAARSHLAAVKASSIFELAGVCTTRKESADETARAYGARHAFTNYHDLLSHPEIEAVAIVLRVPSHYEPTMAALAAGKHVYTEWPLGQTTLQAEEMAAKARASGVCTVVGLQARVSPGLLYVKELVGAGRIGDVAACRVSLFREGSLQRGSDRAWQRDVTLGANTLTIAAGHTIDALRFALTEFSTISAIVATQSKSWLLTDKQEKVDVDAPDNVLINGMLDSGAVASAHIASIPWAGSGYRMEIYGTRGTLVATSADSPQLKEVRVQLGRAGEPLQDLAVPSHCIYVPEAMPQG